MHNDGGLAPAGAAGGGGALMPPDAELVRLSQEGDTSAFDELVTRYRGKIYGMVHNMVRNEADAWDIAQDAFIKAWKALPKYEGRSSFYTWLYRISHNVAYDWLRKRKIQGGVEFDETIDRESIDPHSRTSPRAAPSPDQGVQGAELRAEIDAAIAELSEDHRSVILLKEIEGLSYKEIAEEMGTSLGTVMSRLHYARKKLQETLKDTYESER